MGPNSSIEGLVRCMTLPLNYRTAPRVILAVPRERRLISKEAIDSTGHAQLFRPRSSLHETRSTHHLIVIRAIKNSQAEETLQQMPPILLPPFEPHSTSHYRGRLILNLIITIRRPTLHNSTRLPDHSRIMITTHISIPSWIARLCLSKFHFYPLL